jgi:hypothetical protein
MYCAQCGTLATADAKFCSKCGNPISAGLSERLSKAPSVTSDDPKPLSMRARVVRAFSLYFAGVLLVGIYAAMFIPAFAGQRINPQSGFYSMLSTGWFFYLWWKRRVRKGWHGALVGAAIGILAFCVAAFVSRLMRM